MIQTRIASAVLGGVFLLSVAACGTDKTDSAAGSAPTNAASAPAPAETTAAAAAAPADDKAMCTAADKAAKAMTKEIVKLVGSGADPAPADYAKILNDMNAVLTATAKGDGNVATAMKEVAAQSAKAATLPDPSAGAEDPAFEKAGKELTAACKAAGVKVNF
jgi:hypothetical protein